MATNPSYNQTKKEETQYDYIERDKILQCLPQDDKKDNIKWDTNPSHGSIREAETTFNDNTTQPGCNDTIQVNPSYYSNSREISEDQDGYVKADQYYSHSREVSDYLEIILSTTNDENSAGIGDTDNININPNPLYNLVQVGVKLEDNPSYNKFKST